MSGLYNVDEQRSSALSVAAELQERQRFREDTGFELPDGWSVFDDYAVLNDELWLVEVIDTDRVSVCHLRFIMPVIPH